ncbi:hypothetical protein BX616_002544 [Lobosporangium transversale]|uniref:Alcohol dehydrogenase-like C-terminal domain-containing protein n=1 Tax=Lobosporangium transversale TaxID=64571 RepID=A0A1Y2H3G3_9FUNG|nr:hypothetical protein BCR41DRAFT_366917 [Lobosporangium transversale]KAF9900632.1 hypothetical protein BX616_002544 [Lobosporangium transversale]ORZ28253.1 hypothetical protein BCR41DRAFT_366917 [Lobosporangium transversale]|eukprot:XP_021885938.1 hypothetical protein BCR41DRAFT_366917 [Lobosporangium transversale]
MPPITNTRIVRIKLIPARGKFTTDLVKTETVELDIQLNDGEILIRNLYLALDPCFAVGWEQYSYVTNPKASGVVIIPDPASNPKIHPAEYLSALGSNELTAYAAAERVIKSEKGQVVYISSAAGSVGGFFVFLAKRAGAFVIASAGSDEKAEYLLKHLGANVALNYKTRDIGIELDAASTPRGGIDVYIDLVGGETLDIVFKKIKPNDHIVAIGAISSVGTETPYGYHNFGQIVIKAINIEGFNVLQHLDLYPQLWKEIGPLIASGEFKGQKLTVLKALDNVPQNMRII